MSMSEFRVESSTRKSATRKSSLQRCKLYNPDDGAAALGPGPRYLLGDSSADVLGSS